MPEFPTSELHSTVAERAAELRKYSAVVRWMKILLPVSALGLVVLIFLTGQTRDAIIDLESAGNTAALAAGMRLENPRFAGVTAKGEPFVVTAASALPDGATPNEVQLDEPKGEIRLRAGIGVTVTATDGTIFRQDERLLLWGSVVIETSDGYRAVTDQLEVDMANGLASAPGRLSVDGPRGGIEADRLEISGALSDGAESIMRFEGNVRVRYKPAL